MIWWLLVDRTDDSLWVSDMYVLVMKGELVTVPLLLLTLNRDCEFERLVYHSG